MTHTSTEQPEALLPCPFCGHHAETDYIPEHHSYAIECYSIGCAARVIKETAEDAIAAWNRRQPVARKPLSDDDVGLWIVRTLGAASKQGKYSAISNCVPLGAELVPFFLEFARDLGITQEKQG